MKINDSSVHRTDCSAGEKMAEKRNENGKMKGKTHNRLLFKVIHYGTTEIHSFQHFSIFSIEKREKKK